jgi:hypothetical protein
MICEDCKETFGKYGISPQLGCRKCWCNVIEENARLREALEFYANTDNWLEEINRNNLYTVIKHDASDDYDDGLRFGGKLARQALKGKEE